MGSFPWSAVMISRSPGRSAPSSAGSAASNSSRQAAKPPASLRCPYSVVEVDQVREHEPGLELAQQPGDRRHPLGVARGRVVAGHAPAGEDLRDLAHPVHRHAGRGQDGRAPSARRAAARGRAGRPDRASNAPGRPRERAGDHPRHRVRPGQDRAGRRAGGVQLLQGHDVLVRGDLEDRVGRGVDDRPAGAQVLGPEVLDHVGARGRRVAEPAAPDRGGEGVHHLGREAARVGRRRDVGPAAHQLPVAGGGVLGRRALGQPPHQRRGPVGHRDPRQRRDRPQPEPLQRRQAQAADRRRDVAQRVRAGVAEAVGVDGRAGAHPVQHQHDGPPAYARRATHSSVIQSASSSARRRSSSLR